VHARGIVDAGCAVASIENAGAKVLPEWFFVTQGETQFPGLATLA
jgi:hypothetical protein